MKIFNEIPESRRAFKKMPVLTIGTFDGVHAGVEPFAFVASSQIHMLNLVC